MTGKERTFNELPTSLRAALTDFSDFVRQPIGMVSVGSDREANIYL